MILNLDVVRENRDANLHNNVIVHLLISAFVKQSMNEHPI